MIESRRNIFIVCEGKATEPKYFDEINNLIIAKNIKVNIKISPPPPKESEVNIPFQLREGGEKRQLRNPSVAIPMNNVEDEFKDQPVRYVREAQLHLIEGVYKDVWAVFDKDQHPGHQRAFEKAEELIEGEKVNIAFSSIAFEHWILLHFEQNHTAFTKSMCRLGKDYFFCGENVHQQDCTGNNCVCGKIVNQGYLSYEGKRKKFLFSKFHGHVETAILNAVQLANTYRGNGKPIYELNPYTSIYRLVFKLLHLPLDYSWKEFSDPMQFKHFEANYEVNSSTIIIDFNRLTEGTEIINEVDFVLVDAAGKRVDCASRLVLLDGVDTSSIAISVVRTSAFYPIFIARRINEIEYDISEIPF